VRHRSLLPRQLLTFTRADGRQLRRERGGMESPVAHARGAIMREAVNATDAPRPRPAGSTGCGDQGVPGITDVDTRALVRHIRDAGAMLGGIFPGSTSEEEARALIAAEPSMMAATLAAGRSPQRRPPSTRGDGSGPRIVALGHRHQDLDHPQLHARAAHARAAARARRRRRGARARRRRHLPRPRPGDPAAMARSCRRCAT
jgi:carbamoyl-phosphate synthase small subunit